MRIKMSAMIIAAVQLGSAAPSLAGGAPAAYGYAPAYAMPHPAYGQPVHHARHGRYGVAVPPDRQFYYAAPPRRFFWSQRYMGPEWRPGAHSYARFWD